MKHFLPLTLVFVLLSSCSKSPESTSSTKETPAPPRDEKSPELYRVNLDTSKGPVVIEVHREWAPLGADRFYTLVKSNYLDGVRFFRVIPGFMAQFGIASDPKVTARWNGTELQDDPVRQSNTRGMVSYGTRGANSRTTQMFINFGNNARLDANGFSPFGKVVSGMDAVDQFFSGYGETPDQGSITGEGNAYLDREFPKLDFIKTARIAN